ncbi:MAG: hypothetical protein JXA57_15945 [Armatimonadetes bacterium]|nr:hypothetical protein [Armatimonadota bacterium]
MLSAFVPGTIDAPILDIIIGLGKLPHCFTLQSCYGHFVWDRQPEDENVEPLPGEGSGSVRYRIAYLALCVENSAAGVRIRNFLARVCAVDTEYVQFGSPDWFWRQYPNSYALQVEPKRFATRDEAVLEYGEAVHVQGVRDEVFRRLRELVSGRAGDIGAG